MSSYTFNLLISLREEEQNVRELLHEIEREVQSKPPIHWASVRLLLGKARDSAAVCARAQRLLAIEHASQGRLAGSSGTEASALSRPPTTDRNTSERSTQ